MNRMLRYLGATCSKRRHVPRFVTRKRRCNPRAELPQKAASLMERRSEFRGVFAALEYEASDAREVGAAVLRAKDEAMSRIAQLEAMNCHSFISASGQQHSGTGW